MLRLQQAVRRFSTRPAVFADLFKQQPAPPRLPKEDQEEFERLQREAHNSFAKDDNGELVHPQYHKPYAEFEGDRNPETGEVGGPKQDPLRHGDYSFNGRVTDF